MLTLPTKKKWFDMILTGEKKEEYRDDTRYYESRFDKYIGIPVQVRFRNGYRADSPSFVRTVIPRYRRGGRPEWGAEPDKNYIVLTIQREEKVMDIQGPKTRAEKFLSKEWQTRQDGRNLANDVIGLIDYIGKIQQEQAEREKGCEYCNDEKRMVPKGGYAGEHGFYLAGNALTYSQQVAADDDFEDNCFVNFCPMCGRRLK